LSDVNAREGIVISQEWTISLAGLAVTAWHNAGSTLKLQGDRLC